MTFSGLSEREAEASRQKYGLNERTADISFADYLIADAELDQILRRNLHQLAGLFFTAGVLPEN